MTDFRALIIHSPQRPYPKLLVDALSDVPVSILTDKHHDGAPLMHAKAINDIGKYAADIPVVVFEDDAIPCTNLTIKISQWLSRWNSLDCNVMNFYLGQGSPVNVQSRIKVWLDTADRMSADHICIPYMLSCVAYCIHPDLIPMTRKRLMFSTLTPQTPIDALIGDITGRKVLYTVPSLVDHDTSMPGIVRHRGKRPTTPRRAWRFAG